MQFDMAIKYKSTSVIVVLAWSFIRAIRGETTIAMLLLVPDSYPKRRSNTSGTRAKQRFSCRSGKRDKHIVASYNGGYSLSLNLTHTSKAQSLGSLDDCLLNVSLSNEWPSPIRYSKVQSSSQYFLTWCGIVLQSDWARRDLPHGTKIEYVFHQTLFARAIEAGHETRNALWSSGHPYVCIYKPLSLLHTRSHEYHKFHDRQKSTYLSL